MKTNSKTQENTAKLIIWAAALFVLAILTSILVHILIKGLPSINWGFLTEIPRNMGRSGGISSSIIGTLILTAIAV
ncbi:MAG: phosphate ABC transporter, permease protein PstA, partial [Oscillospiraceae bacterium]|nr:phosphate ABC transporter, permease protein PstA [Oscillospiraceae bacterium]